MLGAQPVPQLVGEGLKKYKSRNVMVKLESLISIYTSLFPIIGLYSSPDLSGIWQRVRCGAC